MEVRPSGEAAPNRDLALWAAGATFFGRVGIVPLVMLALRLAALAVGGPAITAGIEAVIAGLPDRHGTPEALRTLTATALRLDVVGTLVLLFPAALYGEGLRRALLQMAPGEADLWTGWRGRGALVVAGVAAGPPLVLLLLATAPVVAPYYTTGGWSLLGGIAIAFHAVLAVTTVGLVLVYRVVAPGRLPWRAVLVAAFWTGAVLSGFLQGFVLFLAIPVEWSLPFGGLPIFGALTALALWLYLLHVLLLLGYGAARWLADHRLADLAVTVRRGRARSRPRPA